MHTWAGVRIGMPGSKLDAAIGARPPARNVHNAGRSWSTCAVAARNTAQDQVLPGIHPVRGASTAHHRLIRQSVMPIPHDSDRTGATAASQRPRRFTEPPGDAEGPQRASRPPSAGYRCDGCGPLPGPRRARSSRHCFRSVDLAEARGLGLGRDGRGGAVASVCKPLSPNGGACTCSRIISID